MRFESILIVTYGRSGSTLLTGLLNSLDGVLIRGENFNFARGLHDAYRSLQDSHSRFGQGEDARKPEWPWFGAHLLDEEKFIRDARLLIRNQLLTEAEQESIECTGFKEIRYLPDDGFGYDGNYLDEYLSFLSKVFARPAFIFLTREHEQVLGSGWWAGCDPKHVLDQLQRFDAATEKFSASNSACFHITYRDIIDQSPVLRDMFGFLGVSFDDQRVAATLSIEHSVDIRRETYKKVRNYVVETPACNSMDVVELDDLPWQLPTGGVSREFYGVAVLSETCDSRPSLVAVDSQGEHSVEWGKGSPRYARKFPENPRAKSARFKTGRLCIGADSPIEIYLVNDAGHRELLIRLSMKG
jgi:hypothetical protein